MTNLRYREAKIFVDKPRLFLRVLIKAKLLGVYLPITVLIMATKTCVPANKQ